MLQKAKSKLSEKYFDKVTSIYDIIMSSNSEEPATVKFLQALEQEMQFASMAKYVRIDNKKIV